MAEPGVFQYRHLHDDPDTTFALLFVGGDGCYELRREPMLDSRLYAHHRFAPLTPATVVKAIPTYHPIYAGADPAVLRLVDDTCGHGNFRSWARFTMRHDSASGPAGPSATRRSPATPSEHSAAVVAANQATRLASGDGVCRSG